MTRENFEFLKFQADRKYALQKRLLERELEKKYQNLMQLGFHTTAGRVAYQEQLQETYEAELLTDLNNLEGDINAEFFGMRGMEGIAKTLPSTFKIIGTSPNTNQSIFLNLINNTDEKSNK